MSNDRCVCGCLRYECVCGCTIFEADDSTFGNSDDRQVLPTNTSGEERTYCSEARAPIPRG